MSVLWILVLSGAALLLAGRFYSRFLARMVGENPARPTPATLHADGLDFVPTPTPVVFAHHFASIAGAGPIIGPVLAIVYGWVPALAWVLVGGIFFGAVHDYLATYMSTRTHGESMAGIARRMLGAGPFVAFVLCLIVMLSLVTAIFLNLSASALTSTVEMARLGITETSLFRQVVGAQGQPAIVIGGIASTSVILITAFGPLVGWLYIKRKVRVWKCSLLAIGVCAVSIMAGLYYPVSLSPQVWQLMLAAYVLIAAGVPVWIFLQSRDFINVHILYVGMVVLVAVLAVAAVGGLHLPAGGEVFSAGHARMAAPVEMTREVPPLSISQGEALSGLPMWPMLFITIACGAVSGFHSLCAGGTTCKQLTSETASRQIGYYAMLLESFLAVCVIAVCIIGMDMKPYIADVYPKAGASNPVVVFAMAVGTTAHMALGIPIVAGALAGMVLLEGFLVTTLDTAVRLMRYLIEEIWRAMFGHYDVFALPVGAGERQDWPEGESGPSGAGGIPATPQATGSMPARAPRIAAGALRGFFLILRHYWVNSALAVGLMLLFAMTGGANALWSIFGTANQLLAAMVLSMAALWLLQRKRRTWYAIVPAVLMLITSAAALILLLIRYFKSPWQTFAIGSFKLSVPGNLTLIIANIVLMILALYLFAAGAAAAVRFISANAPPQPAKEPASA
ncbi:MAG: carbon starvation CstA family protein [Planctomycetaceae bacterium]|nr:carbon starvation protein A [Planctomycetaceae bacterium]